MPCSVLVCVHVAVCELHFNCLEIFSHFSLGIFMFSQLLSGFLAQAAFVSLPLLYYCNICQFYFLYLQHMIQVKL